MHVNGLHYWPVIRWFLPCSTSTHLFTWLDSYFVQDRDEDLRSHLLKSRLRGVIEYSLLYTWSFQYIWLRSCRGSIDMILFRWMTAFIPWIHVLYFDSYSGVLLGICIYIRYAIYCIMFDLLVSWRWSSKLLALTNKALQPSLPTLLSCFRGYLLHIILSHSQIYTWSVVLCATVITNVVKRQNLCKLIHHELYAQYMHGETEN